jgi:hypothetical protein
MTKNKKNLAISDNMRQTKLKNNFSRVAEEVEPNHSSEAIAIKIKYFS